jgi:hypothetical protein
MILSVANFFPDDLPGIQGRGRPKGGPKEFMEQRDSKLAEVVLAENFKFFKRRELP